MDWDDDRPFEDEGSTGRYALVSALIHLAVALVAVLFAVLKPATKVVVTPIDLTVVPPWAEQRPDDPDPDPNPPPLPKTPPPDPPAPKVPDDVPEPPNVDDKVDALEKVVEKKKPKLKKKIPERGALKNKAILKRRNREDKVPEKKTEIGSMKKNAKLLKVPPKVNLPPGKGTAHDKPLTEEEFRKKMGEGYRVGAKNQLAGSEIQRCFSLIQKRFFDKWDVEYGDPGRYPTLLVKFGPGGRIVSFSIHRSSGNKRMDDSALAAARRAEYVPGLSAQFLAENPVVYIEMKPK